MPEDSGDRERELLKLMSSALVDDLTSAGLNARFLPSGELLPSEGWLVRGAFVQIDEGNRLKRALIGFGSGATRLRVIVWVSDLGHGSSGPFCALDTSTHSSRKPGAALSFDPYVGAARFVLDGLDLDTNVTQIAAQIADDISERSRTGKPPGNVEGTAKTDFVINFLAVPNLKRVGGKTNACASSKPGPRELIGDFEPRAIGCAVSRRQPLKRPRSVSASPEAAASRCSK